MKKLLLILSALLIATPAFCATVTLKFEWDANTEADLAGYRLYTSTIQGVYVKGQYIEQVGKVTTTQDTIDIEAGEIVYYVLTAFDTEGKESAFSNEVSFFLPPDGTGVAPAAPVFRLKSWADAGSK